MRFVCILVPAYERALCRVVYAVIHPDSQRVKYALTFRKYVLTLSDWLAFCGRVSQCNAVLSYCVDLFVYLLCKIYLRN